MKPAIRYHGAKFRIADWVMSFFPEHTCYVEPFGGAAGVLLQKPRAYAEVYNDLDKDVVNFFEVLRNQATRKQLIDAVTITPYARDEFDLSWEPTDDKIEAARRLCVRAQMGFGSAGATSGKTGFRIDTKRDYGTAQHLWAEYPAAIAAAGERFTSVLIENRPAIEVMQQHDAPTTLHFVDPPYMPETRCRQGRAGRYYNHEMTAEQHKELIDALQKLEGFVVLSGYETQLYKNTLRGWATYKTQARISAGRGGGIRTECVWINPAAQRALNKEAKQQRMFA